MPKRYSRQLQLIRENNHRSHPLGVIQVKKDSSNKNNAEVSDRVGMCLELGKTIYQRMSYFVFGFNTFLGVAEN